MIELMLFGTQGCHLCELAEELVDGCLSDASDVTVERTDIAEHSEWYDRYALRIPVLLHPASGVELGWPFGRSDVAGFIALLKR